MSWRRGFSISISLKALSWARRYPVPLEMDGEDADLLIAEEDQDFLLMGDALQVFGLAVGDLQSRGDDAVQVAKDRTRTSLRRISSLHTSGGRMLRGQE